MGVSRLLPKRAFQARAQLLLFSTTITIWQKMKLDLFAMTGFEPKTRLIYEATTLSIEQPPIASLSWASRRPEGNSLSQCVAMI